MYNVDSLYSLDVNFDKCGAYESRNDVKFNKTVQLLENIQHEYQTTRQIWGIWKLRPAK